jgi:hypothetical protein
MVISQKARAVTQYIFPAATAHTLRQFISHNGTKKMFVVRTHPDTSSRHPEHVAG